MLLLRVIMINICASVDCHCVVTYITPAKTKTNNRTSDVGPILRFLTQL